MNTYVVEDNQLVRPAALMVADGEEKALPDNRGDDLLGEKQQQCAANGGEVKVVHLEKKAELEGLAIAHKLPAAENYNVVHKKRDNTRLQGRERCDALLEAEVLGLVARNGLKDLFENGP